MLYAALHRKNNTILECRLSSDMVVVCQRMQDKFLPWLTIPRISSVVCDTFENRVAIWNPFLRMVGWPVIWKIHGHSHEGFLHSWVGSWASISCLVPPDGASKIIISRFRTE